MDLRRGLDLVRAQKAFVDQQVAVLDAWRAQVLRAKVYLCGRFSSLAPSHDMIPLVVVLVLQVTWVEQHHPPQQGPSQQQKQQQQQQPGGGGGGGGGGPGLVVDGISGPAQDMNLTTLLHHTHTHPHPPFQRRSRP